MNLLESFRDPKLVAGLARALAREVVPGRSYRFMEFCGGHTHAIFRYGIPALLPEGIRMIHGPGCPVCVLPMSRVQQAVSLALRPGVTVCTYGDLLRVPDAKDLSLLKARAHGADARGVYSTLDALQIARDNPDRQIVFVAIGFETTSPATAAVLVRARELGVKNFSVLCYHVLTPPAVQHVLEAPQVRDLGAVRIDGFVGPAHVSTVIGTAPFEFFAEEFQKPVVVAGFEPVDVLQAIRMLVTQVNEGRAEVENQYRRAVSREGNARAQELIARLFELRRSVEWRGLGEVPYSGLRLREDWADFDAERRFDLTLEPAPEPKGCLCGAILRGAAEPTDCALFGTRCTPDTPVGSCMVSSEGACAAWYAYRGAARRP